MNKLIAAAIGAAAVLALAIPDASARPRPSRASQSFEANKTFGLGLMIGAPTGLSGKYYLSADTALDFGIGTYYHYRYRGGGLHLHGDFLWHPVVLASADAFELPLYFGVGARFLQHGHRRDFRDDHAHVGVRVPVGILMDFNRVPLDIFFELAFVLDFIVDRDDHGYADLAGAIGVRFYF